MKGRYYIDFPTADPADTSQQIDELKEEAQALVAALKGNAEYEEILEKTQACKSRVEQEWLSNLDTSLPFMQELTGLPLDGRYTVFIMHPSLGCGEYLSAGRIAMGWAADFANEDTSTLWHEVLHDSGILGVDSKIGHAIIELSADNALRVHLNGGNYEPLHGERRRHYHRNKIFNNDWQGYVSSPTKDIRKFKEKMQQKYPSADRQ